ncbi:MAG TPA: HAD hydrolase family protein [Candidatus Hydrogenedentes bacterium]|nr:HAD hydrolase family protein [Candidatus Hydrogenedentota bacterium]HPG65488.1 HAD hydrolase family protein [Candidatus Hydrogenedentota bacterium]
MAELDDRLKSVSLIVCDVDGVLTNGQIPFDGEGRPFRSFHVRDVTALTLWHLAGGRSAVVSGLESKAVEMLAARWRCAECHMRVKDKGAICRDIAARNGVPLEHMAFLGDDFIDLTALRLVGLAVAVADAVPEAKAAAHLVTRCAGGEGALRELVEAILKAQGRYDAAVEAYCQRENDTQ